LANVAQLLLIAPVLLFSMVAHEYAHGWVAFKNGDPTAYQLGRLTWNPVKHIDPFMTILLPVFLALTPGAPILGGAKPVPVNPRNYRNFKRGDILVSLAGITTNILLAFAFTVAIPLLYALWRVVPRSMEGIAIVQEMCVMGIGINLVLAAFNLIPIPPLDGSHVFKYILPPAWALSYERVSRYGLVIILAVLFFFSRALDYWLAPALGLFTLLRGAVLAFLLPMPTSL
jgi:Zn-dependent protease